MNLAASDYQGNKGKCRRQAPCFELDSCADFSNSDR